MTPRKESEAVPNPAEGGELARVVVTAMRDELWVGGVKVHNHLQNENFMAEEKAKLINAAYRLAAREVEKKAYRRAAEITRKAGVPGAADVILRMAEEA